MMLFSAVLHAGQIMAAEGLLRTNPAPSKKRSRRGMSGTFAGAALLTHIQGGQAGGDDEEKKRSPT